MSDYGLNIKNTSGNALISNATAQAAFYRKIPYTNAVYQKQVYAFPNWGYTTPMKPVVFVKYTFECIGTPIIFIRPRMIKPPFIPGVTYKQVYYANALYAITYQQNIGGNIWEIELMIKTIKDIIDSYGAYTFFPDGQPITWQQIEDTKLIPDLFIFTKQKYAPTVDNSQYGLMVRDYNNNINFDSRKRSLIITGSYYENMIGPYTYPDGTRNIRPYPPGTPMTINGAQWNDSSLWLIDLDNRNLQSNIYGANIKAFPRNLAEKRRGYRYEEDICTNVMFHAPVVAQAYTEYTKNGYKKSCGKHGSGSCQEHWSTAKWGVVSRLCVGIYSTSSMSDNGNSNTTGNSKISLYGDVTGVRLQRAFAASKLMYSFSSHHEGTNWYNGGNSSGGYTTGAAPYPAQVINRSGFYILFSDASFYEF